MGFGYLINSMGLSPDFELNIDILASNLKYKWDDIKIRFVETEAYAIRFELTLDGDLILGGFQKDLQTLTLECINILRIAQFAVWYRELVPNEHRLFLYTGATYDAPIEIRSTASLDSIIEHLVF